MNDIVLLPPGEDISLLIIGAGVDFGTVVSDIRFAAWACVNWFAVMFHVPIMTRYAFKLGTYTSSGNAVAFAAYTNVHSFIYPDTNVLEPGVPLNVSAPPTSLNA